MAQFNLGMASVAGSEGKREPCTRKSKIPILLLCHFQRSPPKEEDTFLLQSDVWSEKQKQSGTIVAEM